MKILITLCFMVGSIFSICAQEGKMTFSKSKYFLDNQVLSKKDAYNLIKFTSVAAESQFSKGKRNRFLSNSLAYLGGAFIGYGLADLAFQDNFSPFLFGAGGLLIGISFPIDKSANRKTKSALSIYNQINGFSTNENKRKIKLGAIQNRLAVQFIF